VTDFAKMLPSVLARVIPPRDDNESEAHRIARIQVARDALEPGNPAERTLVLQAVAAHYAAMASFHIAIQPDTDILAVRRCHTDAAAMGREMCANAKALEHRQKPERPALTESAQEPKQPEPEPKEEQEHIGLAPDLTEERLGGHAKRRRILDSAPVQAFWTTYHPMEFDIDAAWSGRIRRGLEVIEAEDAENGIKAHAP
jgi:hypothetical protein